MFVKAIPVFPKGKQCEKNVFAAFKTETGSLKGAVAYISAFSFYQLYVNGRFVAFGPARTAKNYARVDALPLDEYDAGDKNEIIITVAGYGVRCLSTVLQPAFLCAEVRREDRVLSATGADFTAFLPPQKIQKTERYSFQRHFCEVWDFSCGDSLLKDEYKCELEEMKSSPIFIDRRAPYPFYEDIMLDSTAFGGTLAFDEKLSFKPKNYSGIISERWGGFDENDREPSAYEQIQLYAQNKEFDERPLPVCLLAGEYTVFDFSRIETGFIKLSFDALEDCDLTVAFSEDSEKDKFSFTDMKAHNAVVYRAKKGQSVDTMTFEPYVMKYIMVAVKKGSVRLSEIGVKSFTGDVSLVKYPDYSDEVLNAVYRGAVRTFAHNAVDIYTDCPSRERAGWLCDSYFTAKTEYALLGRTYVEDAFLENYRLFKNEGEYPDGVIPMCYPSDDEDIHKFIPQWTMWYILEVEDYVNNRGHQNDKDLFRKSIEGLLSFYERYENRDGLLEKLPSWNFVEWSVANQWTQDVNYPTNMLYARVLECVYLLFGDEKYLQKSRKVQKTAVEQSFRNGIFYDHAIRNEDGSLTLLSDASEAGQYYAILFGGIDMKDEKYLYLYSLLKNVFSADRGGRCPEIAEINAFVGLYLRLEVLLKLEEYKLVLKDVKEFFGLMEKETGTLWEYRQRHGSRDHGFASYALVAIEKSIKNLGGDYYETTFG